MPTATINELEATYLRQALGSLAVATDTLQDLRQKFYTNPPTRVGSGSPEGVVTAPVGTLYNDLANTNGAFEWVKKTGAGNTGWVAMCGDTGHRNVSGLLVNGHATAATTTLRRVDNTVFFQGRLNATAATADVFLTIPAGFVFKYGSFTVPVMGGANVLLRTGTNTAETTARTGGIDFMLSWSTEDAWPSGALPGIAA